MTIAIILLILEAIVFICSVILEHFHHSSIFFSILSLLIVAAALVNCVVQPTSTLEVKSDSSSEESHTFRVIDSADTTIIINGEPISTTTEMKVADISDNIVYTIVVPTEDKLELGTAFEATKKQFEEDYEDRIKETE